MGKWLPVLKRKKCLGLWLVASVTILMFLAKGNPLNVSIVSEKISYDRRLVEKNDSDLLMLERLISKFPTICSRNPEELSVFYNRVPKCGSSVVLSTIDILHDKNRFTIFKSKQYKDYNISVKQQTRVVNFYDTLSKPCFFERHLHFIDFAKFGKKNPLYINVIRDPVERMVSWYYYIRFQGERHYRPMSDARRNMTFDECVTTNHPECMAEYDRTYEGGYFNIIPFFCGQDDFCRSSNRSALEQAKQNVDNFYLVVGLENSIDNFFQVLEYLMPSIFTKARSEFHKIEKEARQHFRTVKKIKPSAAVVDMMRKKMVYEYEFYDFIKKRFAVLHDAVKKSRRTC